MIKIEKTVAGFHVVVTGNNNEILCTSEVLKTLKAARKNLVATAKQFNFERIMYYEVNEITDTKNKMMLVKSNDITPLTIAKHPVNLP